MKFSAPLLVAAAAAGVSAHPSNHHAHNLAHRSAGQFVKYVQPAPEPPATSAAPPPPPPAEPTQAPKKVEAGIFKEEPKKEEPKEEPKPKKESSSGGEGQGVDSFEPFCGGNSKRATVAEIAYTGNIGGSGDAYGCNMKLAKSSAAKEYKYKAKITNMLDEEQNCVAYLKIGPKGLIDGFWSGNEVLNFMVPANSAQYVVADENTQGGIICAAGSMPIGDNGEWGSTWAEFDFGNESNDQWSGADASSLVASRQGLDIPGMEICSDSCGPCSQIWPGGKGKNAFTLGMEAEDGWGLNCVAGPLELDIKVGWSGN